MKRDRQSVNTRQAKMLSMIRERQEIKVEELAKLFDVSLMTVRRDLQTLEDRHLISRFYGGATVDPRATSTPFKDDVSLYRQLIARYAASLVRSNESIFINGSDTALGLLEFIGDRHVNVFTNNGNAVKYRFPSNTSITLLGGMLRGQSHIMTGDHTMRNLLMTQTDISFIGCAGISPDGEILCGIPTELGINETMISHSRKYYILADHTKIGKSGTYASCSLEKTGTVITDELASAKVIERLRFIGMDVIQVRRSDFPEVCKPDDTL